MRVKKTKNEKRKTKSKKLKKNALCFSHMQVIKEERRLRVENATYGSFTEAFQELAFPGLPYRRPVIGYRIQIYY